MLHIMTLFVPTLCASAKAGRSRMALTICSCTSITLCSSPSRDRQRRSSMRIPHYQTLEVYHPSRLRTPMVKAMPFFSSTTPTLMGMGHWQINQRAAWTLQEVHGESGRDGVLPHIRQRRSRDREINQQFGADFSRTCTPK